MEWSEVNIDRCPVCGNDWEDKSSLSFCLGKECRTSRYILINSVLDIYRNVGEYIITWAIADEITVVHRDGEQILETACALPFDITEEKLKTYILFS